MTSKLIIWLSVVAVIAFLGAWIAVSPRTSEPEPAFRQTKVYDAAKWTPAVKREVVP